MHTLGNRMRLSQTQVSINRNLHINIDLFSKYSGSQQVNPANALLAFDVVPHLLGVCIVTGAVCQLLNRIPENVNFKIKRQMTTLAIGSSTGKPARAATIPISEPMEENASER